MSCWNLLRLGDKITPRCTIWYKCEHLSSDECFLEVVSLVSAMKRPQSCNMAETALSQLHPRTQMMTFLWVTTSLGSHWWGYTQISISSCKLGATLSCNLCSAVSLAAAPWQEFILTDSLVCQRNKRRRREALSLPRKGSLVSMPLRTVPGPYLALSGSQGASTLSPGSKECFIPFTYSRMSSLAVFCTHRECLPRDTSGLANSTRNIPLSFYYQEQNTKSSEKQPLMCQVMQLLLRGHPVPTWLGQNKPEQQLECVVLIQHWDSPKNLHEAHLKARWVKLICSDSLPLGSVFPFPREKAIDKCISQTKLCVPRNKGHWSHSDLFFSHAQVFPHYIQH